MGSANEPSKPAANWDALNKAPNTLWQAIEPIFEFRDSIAKTTSHSFNRLLPRSLKQSTCSFTHSYLRT